MKVKKPNIGLLIEQRMNELGITKSELARRCGIANQNINRILTKTDIDTDKLATICEALDCNFFDYYKADSPAISVSGSHNQVVGHGTHGNVSVAADAVLAERVKSLEALLAEKERLISVLMSCNQTSAPCSHTQNM